MIDIKKVRKTSKNDRQYQSQNQPFTQLKQNKQQKQLYLLNNNCSSLDISPQKKQDLTQILQATQKIQKSIRSKRNSSYEDLKQIFFTPIFILVLYFISQMIITSTFMLTQDIFTAFKQFFAQIKKIFEEYTLFLIFWAVIIIKAKIPQLQRLFYHTVIINTIANQDETQCSICLTDKCDYMLPKCHHLFHIHCLQKWIKTQGMCPYCRIKVENKIQRQIPWKKVLSTVLNNKLKWILIFITCFFVQQRLNFTLAKAQ